MMDDLSSRVEAHYYRNDLYNSILSRLTEMGLDPSSIAREDISGMDELHVRGAEVSEEMGAFVDFAHKKVLDVGSGLGGPARMLAEKYGSIVTGIDLCEQFVDTANRISKLLGIEDNTSFIKANALDLPFESNCFDIVWTQHVQMNIKDKKRFYSEIYRVLKTGGYFVYYDIFRKNKEEIQYPMPWSNTSDMSFLFTKKELSEILKALGLENKRSIDQTNAGIMFFKQMKERKELNDNDFTAMNSAMGEDINSKLMNLLMHLENGILELESGVYKK
jgi:ubiquinone/menaquinone biosynthesis C-methylase UbiE